MGYWGGVAKSSSGLSGGICLWWRRGVALDIWQVKSNYIHAVFRAHADNIAWSFFGVYAPTQYFEKVQFWEEMKVKLSRLKRPWIIMGDLNVLLDSSEKQGGTVPRWRKCRILRNFLAQSGGVDLGSSGGFYTWNNGRDHVNLVRERLDRVIGSHDWLTSFQKAGVKTLAMIGSDHAPLIFDTHMERERTKRPFRFFEVWTNEESCRHEVQTAWEEEHRGGPGTLLVKKMHKVGIRLSRWSKQKFGKLREEIQELENRLLQVQNLAPTQTYLEEEAQIQIEIQEKWRQTESMSRQRSRELWLHHGDRNSKFFHTATIIRRKRNFIWAIKQENGNWIRSRKEIGNYLNQNFTNLFRTSNPEVPEDFSDLIHAEITEEENKELTAIPTRDEVRKCVWNMHPLMHPLKAPGPDGLQGIFYRTYWGIIGDQVVHFVQDFFRTGHLPRAINHAHIVLIPKTLDATSVDKFRPISLCNFSFKLITKIITTRLRRLMGKLVSPLQSAFIPGRGIEENAILARELVHVLKKKKGRGGLIGIKIDMAKAYDRMEWPFIIRVLKMMGFSEKFTDLINQCLNTTSSSILLNGSPLNRIPHSRGLRQGDPLSPYLFILGAEIFSRLLLREARLENIHGIRIGRNTPPISHLMFADDMFLFCRAKIHEVETLKKCLAIYEKWSGQKVNLGKSGVLFSKNCSADSQAAILASLNMTKIQEDVKYLGNPLFVGRNKAASFDHIRKKINDRLEGWMSKVLSQAGRTTMIKSVIQAIPQYAMSTHKLPTGFNRNLDALVRRFWWTAEMEKKHYLSLLNWDSLCKPLHQGGLGFRKFEDVNRALLARIGWKLASNPEGHFASILKAKYFPNCNFLNSQQVSSPSPSWRDIQSSRNLILNHSTFMVGDGSSISILEDKWGQFSGSLTPKPPRFIENQHVNFLFNSQSRTWDRGKINTIFEEESARKIFSTKIRPHPYKDKLVWTPTKQGIFSVKSAYKVIATQQTGTQDPIWKKIWNLNFHNRLKFFLWRIAAEALPTASRLYQRGIIDDETCTLCGQQAETLPHLFLFCSFARAIWFAAGRVMHNTGSIGNISNGSDIIRTIMELPSIPENHTASNPTDILFATLVMDQIWKARNEKRTQDATPNPLTSLRKATSLFSEHLIPLASPDHASQSTVPRAQAWSPPEFGWIKFNTDATFKENRAFAGVIARDNRGIPKLAWVGKTRAKCPMEAELEAILRAARLAEINNWQAIILEGDCKMLLDALRERKPCPIWTLEPLYLEVLGIANSLDSFLFNWVPRNVNSVAHSLATWAFSHNRSGFLNSEDVPPSVRNILYSELLQAE